MIPARELRNHVSEVLRRVEAGEHLIVTVSGRPVAELNPIDPRPTFMRWDEFWNGLEAKRADPGLRDELRELLPETTDDLPWR
jgi:prevent-host-death family protein